MSALDELIEATTDTCVEDPLRSTAKAAMRELAALRERVAKLEAALVKADEASASADKVTSVPQYNQIANVFSLAEWRISELSEAMIAYRTAREATK